MIASAAFALAPASVGAHPRECAITAVTAAPAAEWFTDWSADNCTNAPAMGSFDAPAATPRAVAAVEDRKHGDIKQVGHEPLLNRGMNAAIALHGDYAYIGSRTDGGHEGMPQGGIVVVDISDPSDPELLGRRSTPSRASRRASCASGSRKTS